MEGGRTRLRDRYPPLAVRRPLVALLAACLLLGTASAARAQDPAPAPGPVSAPRPAVPAPRGPFRPAVGIGEQDPAVFSNRWFTRLGVRQVHHLVGWDVLDVRWQRERLSAFLSAAQAEGVNVLVAFGVSARERRRHVAPSPRTYKRAFRAFRKRYPQVTDFVIWNEANHCSQPVCHRPERVARYFKAARSVCRRCKLVGADVLDSASMRGWITRFKRALGGARPDAWGLHNYVDANRRRTASTRWLLANVRGAVWFTETGGLVRRRTTSPIKFPQGLTHATRTTRWVLTRLGTLSPRVQRIYLYHFVNQGADQSWDSGLLNPLGSPRPAYRVLERWLRRAHRLPAQRPAP